MNIFERQKKINAQRKLENPSWPTHKSYFYDPHNRQERIISQCVPVGKASMDGYCKYCYKTHDNWWNMDDADYNVPGQEETTHIVLCGECEHASREDMI